MTFSQKHVQAYTVRPNKITNDGGVDALVKTNVQQLLYQTIIPLIDYSGIRCGVQK